MKRPKSSIELRRFLNSLEVEEQDHPAEREEHNYDSVLAQLKSISWQLKRIADLMENKS